MDASGVPFIRRCALTTPELIVRQICSHAHTARLLFCVVSALSRTGTLVRVLRARTTLAACKEHTHVAYANSSIVFMVSAAQSRYFLDAICTASLIFLSHFATTLLAFSVLSFEKYPYIIEKFYGFFFTT